MKKIRVLIVDDSPLIRIMLRRQLENDREIEVVGAAKDPYEARDLLIQTRPDVMVLDIQMPKMDGITFLGKVMKHFPIRTLIYSSLCTEGSEMVLSAMSAGAIDVLGKPSITEASEFKKHGQELAWRIKAISKAKVLPGTPPSPQNTYHNPNQCFAQCTHDQPVIAIASSTGGTEALKKVLSKLPSGCPPILIVQHIPAVFAEAYTKSLQTVCCFPVKMATKGAPIEHGVAYVAPGGYHMEIVGRSGKLFIELHQKPLQNGVRPSADYLLHSVADEAPHNSIGVVLTGMGRDGANGLLAMKKRGTYNIAQDEASCVIFGMPKEAIKIDAIDKICPLDRIATEIVRKLGLKKAA